MAKITRKYAESDRTWVEPLVGTTAIDAKGNHIEIVEDGVDKAVAIWFAPEDGDVAFLGPVLGVGPERRDLIYAAVIAACEAALVEGYTKGHAMIRDGRMVTRLVRDLGLEAVAHGRNTTTDKPSKWNIDIDLADIVTKLKGFV